MHMLHVGVKPLACLEQSSPPACQAAQWRLLLRKRLHPCSCRDDYLSRYLRSAWAAQLSRLNCASTCANARICLTCTCEGCA